MLPKWIKDDFFPLSLRDGKILEISNNKKNIEYSFAPDENGQYTIAYNINLRKAYFERPNNASRLLSLPFIETKTAVDLLSAFEMTGLTLSNNLEDAITNGKGSDRFGSACTQITREIAKLVNDANRKDYTSIFKEAEQLEEKILSLNAENFSDKTAQSIIKLLQEIIQRNALLRESVITSQKEALISGEIPVTQSRVSMTDGSCFDSIGYFEQAHNLNKLQLERYNGKRMIHKKHGADTYMNADPIQFNGITVPPGALFKKGEDGGYALVRLTPYMDLKDPSYGAFAPEVIKASNGYDSKLTPLFDIYK